MNTPTQQQLNAQARLQAQAAMEGLAVKPTARVEYRSHGRVAIIGTMEALEFAPRLQDKHKTTVVLVSGAEEPSTAVIPLAGRPLAIQGYLGNFTLRLGIEGKPNYETLNVDLVLDLSPQPQLSMPLPPLGYLHSGIDEDSLQQAQAQLDELTGTFEKPRFFDYDASICAHARSGKSGCNACIEACPAEAITSLAEAIEVNPYLCQGGGICTSVCPTGAIRYNYPSAADMLQRIRTLLQVYREKHGQQPIILVVAEDDLPKISQVAPNVLTVLVEEVASVGLDIWLSTLAYGAKQIRLFAGGSIPANVITALQAQLTTAREILHGLGYPDDAVQLIGDINTEYGVETMMPDIPAASYAGFNEKRRVMFMAIDHLYQHGQPAEAILSLSAGAPFGTIAVNARTCTLCLSCTSVCPTHAVYAGNEEPMLVFDESRCVQCGICAAACPEQAITLTPRLLADPLQRQQHVTLHHEEPLCCIRCGKPFATQSVVNAMLAKLGNHWMFQSERARQRLLMCDDCRVADIVQDPEAMAAGVLDQRRQ
ncbi:MAG: 4Fe-4S dicluster domain-containing protein [Gammaproteobacteria bacterium]|nr:4Fe-4S dicluster domain-containing protein [Gammaproteobacteria bacterium]